jgi:hypothetical protein
MDDRLKWAPVASLIRGTAALFVLYPWHAELSNEFARKMFKGLSSSFLQADVHKEKDWARDQ